MSESMAMGPTGLRAAGIGALKAALGDSGLSASARQTLKRALQFFQAAEEAETAEDVLREMRETGWAVAAHNDYWQNGLFHTFYLLAHRESSRCVKGEGRSELEALGAARVEALSLGAEVWRPRSPVSGRAGAGERFALVADIGEGTVTTRTLFFRERAVAMSVRDLLEVAGIGASVVPVAEPEVPDGDKLVARIMGYAMGYAMGDLMLEIAKVPSEPYAMNCLRWKPSEGGEPGRILAFQKPYGNTYGWELTHEGVDFVLEQMAPSQALAQGVRDKWAPGRLF